jgi:hypothetical protein
MTFVVVVVGPAYNGRDIVLKAIIEYIVASKYFVSYFIIS